MPINPQYLVVSLVNIKTFTRYTRRKLINYMKRFNLPFNIHSDKKVFITKVMEHANERRLNKAECSICYNIIRDPIQLGCKHVYCM